METENFSVDLEWIKSVDATPIYVGSKMFVGHDNKTNNKSLKNNFDYGSYVILEVVEIIDGVLKYNLIEENGCSVDNGGKIKLDWAISLVKEGYWRPLDFVTPKDLYGKNIKELEPYIYNI
jgi:hypothetical protein